MTDVTRHRAKPRVAVVAHVGYAKSHLLRATAIHCALQQTCDSRLILPEKSRDFFQQFFPNTTCEWVSWLFSHNHVFEVRLSELVIHLRKTMRDLDRIFNAFAPDLVIGVPGIQTSPICRALGIRHAAVLHGPWLVPEYLFDDLRPDEKTVLDAWERAIELTDTMSTVIAHALGQHYGGYREWLDREEVWIGQDFDISYRNKRPMIGFLQTDFGPPTIEGLPQDCLSICLGTAIDHTKTVILSALQNEDRPRLVVGGPEVPRTPDIYWRPSLAGKSLAQISSIAVSHGGIGTIALFAGAHVPQVFVPHDLDQATNAILAHRAGFGSSISLDYWKRRTPFGRILPPFQPKELRQLVRRTEIGSSARRPFSNNSTALLSLVSGGHDPQS